VHPGEKIKGAAQRELAEETGHKARKLTPLLTFHSSKSVMDETAHLFVGENLRKAALKPDDTEFIQTQEFPFDKVLKMVLSGEIKDAMTVIAVLAAAQVKGA
jgi:ADP-ribose pyrophosphatase